MTIHDVEEIAVSLFHQVHSKPALSDDALIAGIIYGACEYALTLDIPEDTKFKCFIERLKETVAARHMSYVIDAFLLPKEQLALNINSKSLAVSTIIEYRMRREL